MAIEPYCDREFREPDVEAPKRSADYAGEQASLFKLFFHDDSCGNGRCTAADRPVGGPCADVVKIWVHRILTIPYQLGLNHNFPRLPFSAILRWVVRSIRDVYDYAEQAGVKCVYEDQGYVFNGHERFERPAGSCQP